jgi:hypothetical protein
MMTAGRRETPEIAVVGEVLYHLTGMTPSIRAPLVTGELVTTAEGKSSCSAVGRAAGCTRWRRRR